MTHTPDFVKKMNQILEYYQLTAGAFADKIGVQRSSISHLLSGRNKPSLEFVLKIVSVFPEVDLYWLLLNEGVFPKNATENHFASNPTVAEEINSINDTKTKPLIDIKTLNAKSTIGTATAKITQIVLLYSDGTFQSFDPS